MNSSQIIESILEYIAASREQKTKNIVINGGLDPLKDRHNCGAIAALNDIQDKIFELVKPSE